MKKIITLIIAAAVTITTNAFAGSSDVLQKKLDAAVAASDWAAAEKISAILVNTVAIENHRQQTEFFREQTEVTSMITNFYKATPQMLRVVQAITPNREGTDENFAIHVAAPQLLKVLQTGSFDADLVIREWKKLEDARRAARLEREKRWKEQKLRWEAERRQREAERAKRLKQR